MYFIITPLKELTILPTPAIWSHYHLPDVRNLIPTNHFPDVGKKVFSATNQMQKHTNQLSVAQGRTRRAAREQQTRLKPAPALVPHKKRAMKKQ